MKENVAITKCFVCGKGSDILLATRYYRTKEGVQPVTDMAQFNGKVINKEPCEECKKILKIGVILISVLDSTKEEDENPFRTGSFVAITKKAASRIFNGKETPVMFIPDTMWKSLDLPLSEYQKKLFESGKK